VGFFLIYGTFKAGLEFKVGMGTLESLCRLVTSAIDCTAVRIIFEKIRVWWQKNRTCSFF